MIPTKLQPLLKEQNSLLEHLFLPAAQRTANQRIHQHFRVIKLEGADPALVEVKYCEVRAIYQKVKLGDLLYCPQEMLGEGGVDCVVEDFYQDCDKREFYRWLLLSSSSCCTATNITTIFVPPWPETVHQQFRFPFASSIAALAGPIFAIHSCFSYRPKKMSSSGTPISFRVVPELAHFHIWSVPDLSGWPRTKLLVFWPGGPGISSFCGSWNWGLGLLRIRIIILSL